MASVYKEIVISAEAEQVRRPIRYVGAMHQRFDVVFSLLREWRRRRLGRAVLCHMCADELRDIGLTPAEAAREGRKPFWWPKAAHCGDDGDQSPRIPSPITMRMRSLSSLSSATRASNARMIPIWTASLVLPPLTM